MTDITAKDGWRSRCIDSERAVIWHGQRILGVHALIAQAKASGSETVAITDLTAMLGGPLEEPNSVIEWSKRPGGLGRPIGKLFASARTEAP